MIYRLCTMFLNDYLYYWYYKKKQYAWNQYFVVLFCRVWQSKIRPATMWGSRFAVNIILWVLMLMQIESFIVHINHYLSLFISSDSNSSGVLPVKRNNQANQRFEKVRLIIRTSSSCASSQTICDRKSATKRDECRQTCQPTEVTTQTSTASKVIENEVDGADTSLTSLHNRHWQTQFDWIMKSD